MNLLMLMGFLGLFSLTLSAASPIKKVDDPGDSQQRSLQEQIFQINKNINTLNGNQFFIYTEQSKANCKIGALEMTPSTHFDLIKGPDGLYMKKDNGELILIEKYAVNDPVANIFNEKPLPKDHPAVSGPAPESAEAEAEADLPDHNKVEVSDIYIDSPETVTEMKEEARKAEKKVEVLKAQSVKLITEGNKKVNGHKCSKDQPDCVEVLPIECKNMDGTRCKARVDNHKPMKKDNLKEFSQIKDEEYYSVSNDPEIKRALERMSYEF